MIRRTRQAQPQTKTSWPSSTTRQTDFGESVGGQQKDRGVPSSSNRTSYPQGNSEYEYSDSELLGQDVTRKSASAPLFFLADLSARSSYWLLAASYWLLHPGAGLRPSPAHPLPQVVLNRSGRQTLLLLPRQSPVFVVCLGRHQHPKGVHAHRGAERDIDQRYECHHQS
jgi:hypothetical protein